MRRQHSAVTVASHWPVAPAFVKATGDPLVVRCTFARHPETDYWVDVWGNRYEWDDLIDPRPLP
jgi:hypothetical protein